MIDKNEYMLAWHAKMPEHHKVTWIRPVSSTELENYYTARKKLGNYSNYCDLYEICDKNYSSIISYLPLIKDGFSKNRERLHEYTEESIQEINRLFLNYLSSSRTFLDHLKTRYTRLKQQGSSYLDDYTKITTACFDSNFSYRFFYKLRNYVQHCGLPLTLLDYEESLDSNEMSISKISIAFSRDTLLQDYDQWGPVKSDLMKQPERMEFLPYFDAFRSQIELVHIVMLGIEISLASNSWQYLYDMVHEVQDKYGNVMPFIGRKSMYEGGGEFQMSDFPLHTMAKFQASYKKIQDFQGQQKTKNKQSSNS